MFDRLCARQPSLAKREKVVAPKLGEGGLRGTMVDTRTWSSAQCDVDE
jgi:hypothetical protein